MTLESRIFPPISPLLLWNGHGDVAALITGGGDIKATYYYDAFGNTLDTTGTADNPYRYAGYQYDEETGLYYLNARYYDSKTARFLTEDSYMGSPNDPLSLNLYTYCHNEPMMYTDPTGHLSYGDSGEDVEALQRELEHIYDENGNPLFTLPKGADYGYYGWITEKAVKKLQKMLESLGLLDMYYTDKNGKRVKAPYGTFGDKTKAGLKKYKAQQTEKKTNQVNISTSSGHQPEGTTTTNGTGTVNITLDVETGEIKYSDSSGTATYGLPSELYSESKDSWLSNMAEITLMELTTQWYKASTKEDRDKILKLIKTARKAIESDSLSEWFTGYTEDLVDENIGGIIGGILYKLSGKQDLDELKGECFEARGGYIVGSIQYLAGNALNTGNLVHYDQLNGGKGSWLPSELQSMYPETRFRFTARGESGWDIEVKGGVHPSEYAENPMEWKSGNNFGDFKPGTKSGWKKFLKDVKTRNTPAEYIPYDPETGKIMKKSGSSRNRPGIKFKK